jgi:hypothetical protein
MDDAVTMFFKQLAHGAPVLLVYVVGLILALVFWRRCPLPCALALIGTGLLLVATLAQMLVFVYLVRGQLSRGWSQVQFSWMLSANAFAGGFFRAVGFGLVLAAVFVRRPSDRSGRPPWVAEPVGPVAKGPDEHGITDRPAR